MKLSDLQTVLDEWLNVAVHAGTDDQNGVFLPSDRPIQRLGLALEPFPDLIKWVTDDRLDALFIHRPWQLTNNQRVRLLAHEVGVLAYHLAFDERLTTGFNPTLAARCGWAAPELLGEKEGRPLGMICSLPKPVTFQKFAVQMDGEFGGAEERRTPTPSDDSSVEKVAVVGAMTDALVRAAAAAGAGVYVTGQFRQPARRAVEETGLGVIALGHQRSEIWGLRALARLLKTHPATSALEVFVPTMV